MQKNVYELISKQTNDPIIEWKTCTVSGQEFPIFQSDLDFLEKISPTFAGSKHPLPLPALCPEERQRRRLMFRNERKLYRRNCDATGKPIITVYSPDPAASRDGASKPYKVYDQNIRWWDSWDPFQYGMDFDFNKTFFDQYKDLFYDTPHLYLVNIDTENSYYTNYALQQKNCYLIFGWAKNEDCSNSAFLFDSVKCNDMLSSNNCEFSFEWVDCEKMYSCYYAVNCKECSNCVMIEDCVNCSNCIACFGIANQEYCYLNKKYSKEEFKNIEDKYKNLTNPKVWMLRQELGQLKKDLPHMYAHIYNSENCIGNVISHSKNCIIGFDVLNVEDCKYVYSSPNSVRSQDCVFNAADGVKNSYNVCSTVWLDTWITTFLVWYGSNMFYCMECFHCNDCFGCIWLKNQQYCIFNKQYSKEEYDKLVSQIVDKMIADKQRGEYFDLPICPFGYNETVAMEYFPMTRDEAIKRWYKRQDNNYDPVVSKEIKALKWDQIPGDIEEVQDDVLDDIFICEVSDKPFRINKQELDFYRKHHLPLPRIHPDIRHQQRFAKRPLRDLHVRNCDKCGMEMLSVYEKKDECKVYCDVCYNKEVYG